MQFDPKFWSLDANVTLETIHNDNEYAQKLSNFFLNPSSTIKKIECDYTPQCSFLKTVKDMVSCGLTPVIVPILNYCSIIQSCLIGLNENGIILQIKKDVLEISFNDTNLQCPNNIENVFEDCYFILKKYFQDIYVNQKVFFAFLSQSLSFLNQYKSNNSTHPIDNYQKALKSFLAPIEEKNCFSNIFDNFLLLIFLKHHTSAFLKDCDYFTKNLWQLIKNFQIDGLKTVQSLCQNYQTILVQILLDPKVISAIKKEKPNLQNFSSYWVEGFFLADEEHVKIYEIVIIQAFVHWTATEKVDFIKRLTTALDSTYSRLTKDHLFILANIIGSCNRNENSLFFDGTNKNYINLLNEQCVYICYKLNINPEFVENISVIDFSRLTQSHFNDDDYYHYLLKKFWKNPLNDTFIENIVLKLCQDSNKNQSNYSQKLQLTTVFHTKVLSLKQIPVSIAYWYLNLFNEISQLKPYNEDSLQKITNLIFELPLRKEFWIDFKETENFINFLFKSTLFEQHLNDLVPFLFTNGGAIPIQSLQNFYKQCLDYLFKKTQWPSFFQVVKNFATTFSKSHPNLVKETFSKILIGLKKKQVDLSIYNDLLKVLHDLEKEVDLEELIIDLYIECIKKDFLFDINSPKLNQLIQNIIDSLIINSNRTRLFFILSTHGYKFTCKSFNKRNLNKLEKENPVAYFEYFASYYFSGVKNISFLNEKEWFKLFDQFSANLELYETHLKKMMQISLELNIFTNFNDRFNLSKLLENFLNKQPDFLLDIWCLQSQLKLDFITKITAEKIQKLTIERYQAQPLKIIPLLSYYRSFSEQLLFNCLNQLVIITSKNEQWLECGLLTIELAKIDQGAKDTLKDFSNKIIHYFLDTDKFEHAIALITRLKLIDENILKRLIEKDQLLTKEIFLAIQDNFSMYLDQREQGNREGGEIYHWFMQKLFLFENFFLIKKYFAPRVNLYTQYNMTPINLDRFYRFLSNEERQLSNPFYHFIIVNKICHLNAIEAKNDEANHFQIINDMINKKNKVSIFFAICYLYSYLKIYTVKKANVFFSTLHNLQNTAFDLPFDYTNVTFNELILKHFDKEFLADKIKNSSLNLISFFIEIWQKALIKFPFEQVNLNPLMNLLLNIEDSDLKHVLSFSSVLIKRNIDKEGVLETILSLKLDYSNFLDISQLVVSSHKTYDIAKYDDFYLNFLYQLIKLTNYNGEKETFNQNLDETICSCILKVMDKFQGNFLNANDMVVGKFLLYYIKHYKSNAYFKLSQSQKNLAFAQFYKIESKNRIEFYEQLLLEEIRDDVFLLINSMSIITNCIISLSINTFNEKLDQEEIKHLNELFNFFLNASINNEKIDDTNFLQVQQCVLSLTLALRNISLLDEITLIQVLTFFSSELQIFIPGEFIPENLQLLDYLQTVLPNSFFKKRMEQAKNKKTFENYFSNKIKNWDEFKAFYYLLFNQKNGFLSNICSFYIQSEKTIGKTIDELFLLSIYKITLEYLALYSNIEMDISSLGFYFSLLKKVCNAFFSNRDKIGDSNIESVLLNLTIAKVKSDHFSDYIDHLIAFLSDASLALSKSSHIKNIVLALLKKYKNILTKTQKKALLKLPI